MVDPVGLLMRRFYGTICAAAALALTAPACADAATARSGEAIVQFDAGVGPAAQRAAVRAVGGRTIRDLHVIHALGVRLPAGAAARLARSAGVRAVTPNSAVTASAAATQPQSRAWSPGLLATAFDQSTRTDRAWTNTAFRATGKGVTVAEIDTGVAGDLPDFRVSRGDPASRVIASVVTNPDATTAEDRYGHGTHVAGLIAGDGNALDASDPLAGRYVGTAPKANLVSIKASDDHGNSSLIDVIAGLQFAVDHKDTYGIRVVNLSMNSTVARSYRTDPLDAAAEAAWFHGIVVVTAAGNRGAAADAVAYAPANDPFVITVGAVDDHGTKDTADDTLAGWSSRGATQDGFAKPDIVAPGAHIVAPLAPGSDFPSLCPACVVDGRYFRIGGTSMAAPVVAGIVADLLSTHPDWTPDQVKGALTYRGGHNRTWWNPRPTADGAWEVAADNSLAAGANELSANEGVVPSDLIDPATGSIDYSRASWSRASWSSASELLRASWSRASWSCACGDDMLGGSNTTRASWSRASWSSFFGDDPSTYGELRGGTTGAATAAAAGATPMAPTSTSTDVRG
jgi:serine protease AprX